MDDPKHKHIPAPGLPESLHPEIGNGSAWESDKHNLLLRLPDPAKLLESWSPALVSSVPLEASVPADASAALVETPDLSDPDLTEPVKRDADVPEADSKNKKKKKKKHKLREEPESTPTEEHGDSQESSLVSPPKAGKRLRKAAERIHQQEELPHMAENEDIKQLDSSLSPFTRWLKNLAGSEYVHPYEDDFALAGSQHPPKQGISETFADLLASQGHILKAIEMYNRLMEKYPEKSAFFAAKIEALQSS